MSLVQMGFSGAVMIVFTVVIRALLLYKLPKRMFTILWCFVLGRLLIPFSLPCAFSAYSIFSLNAVSEKVPENITTLPENITTLPDFFPERMTDIPNDLPGASASVPAINWWFAFWLTGVLLCSMFFAVTYIVSRVKFRESVPVENEFIRQWLAEHRTFRRIDVRCTDRISTPLTYGVFRPVILLPKKFGHIESDDLKFVLTHEYIHIRRFDAVFKLLLTAALCVHWFNPLVWVMLIIANKDIEISCDEAVVRMLGEQEKRAYAMTLVRMEEIKSGLMPLGNNFSKNPVKERIVMIMNFKKTTALTVIVSACLVIGTTTVFATSAPKKTADDIPNGGAASITNESKPDASLTSGSENSETVSGSTESSEPEQSETSAEPVEEKTVSVEDWLKQPHSSPLANVNAELDPTGDYTFIPAEQGTEVYAIDDGEVVYVGTDFNHGLGAVVAVGHAEGVYTIYGHLNYDFGFEVSVGDSVKAGQCIGYAGISGNIDRYGLCFICRDSLPDFEWVPVYDEDNAPKETPNDYDYIKPVDGIGFITGRYK